MKTAISSTKSSTRPQDPSSELLATAQDALSRAEWAPTAALRYELAYLAALRGGAAVLARRARPRSLRTRPRGLWALLAKTAPELAEWGAFFECCGTQCAALAEGRSAVSVRQADDLLRDAAAFLAVVTGAVSGAGPSVEAPVVRA